MRALAILALVLASCTETPRVVITPPPTTPAAPTTPARTPTPPPTTAAPTRTASPTPAATASPTPTARPTATASPSPARTASGSLPTPPPEPTLPPGSTVVLAGERVFTLAAGEQRVFDPAELARDAGRTAPACGSLAWTAAWASATSVRAAFIAQSGRVDLGQGRWGTASLGCSTLELRNDGSASTDVILRFTIGATR